MEYFIIKNENLESRSESSHNVTQVELENNLSSEEAKLNLWGKIKRACIAVQTESAGVRKGKGNGVGSGNEVDG